MPMGSAKGHFPAMSIPLSSTTLKACGTISLSANEKMGIGRVTLGLYNSYDKKRFTEAHRRALARAGPLAFAFDANIATFGFPFPTELRTPKEVAEWVATGTSIGEHGAHLTDVALAGRFSVFDLPSGGFPPQLGRVVITTSRPSPRRATSIVDLVDLLRGGTSLLLLFGLGPHGLPSSLREGGEYHLDITGRGVSLETCTALGAVASTLASLLRV